MVARALAPYLQRARTLFLLSVEIFEGGSIRWRDESRWVSRMRGLEAKFQDFIASARAHGDRLELQTRRLAATKTNGLPKGLF